MTGPTELGLAVPAGPPEERPPLPEAVFVGRERELAHLLQALEEARRGGAGRFVLIEGERGIGKSRLLSQLRTEAEAKGVRVLEGFTLPGGRPYAPFLLALEGVPGSPFTPETAAPMDVFLIHRDGRLVSHYARGRGRLDEDLLSGMLTAIRSFIDQSFRPGGTGSLDEIRYGDSLIIMEQGDIVYLASVIPESELPPGGPGPLRNHMRDVLTAIELRYGEPLMKWDGEKTAALLPVDDLVISIGLPRPSAVAAPADVGPDREKLYERTVALLGGNPGGTLLLLDDLQGLDASSASLLGHLAGAARRLPLLIVGAARQEALAGDGPFGQLHRRLQRERSIQVASLARLRRDEVGHLAVGFLPGARIPAPFLVRLQEATGGNPYYVREVLQSLIVAGSVVQDRATGLWSLRTSELVIPPDVGEAVGRRLQTLPLSARATLRAAAVLGRTWSLDHLIALTRGDEDGIIGDVDTLLRSGLLREAVGTGRSGSASASGSASESYEFDHDILREVVERELPEDDCRRLHREAVRVLGPNASPFLLAHHAAAAGDEEQATIYGLAAARRALAESAPSEARTHLEAVIAAYDRAGKGASREAQDVGLLYGATLTALGEWDGALGTIRDALRSARRLGAPDLEARGLVQLGGILRERGSIRDAKAALESGLLMAASASLPLVAVEAHRGLARLAHLRGDLDAADRELQAALAALRTAGSPPLDEARVLLDIGNTSSQRGDHAAALQAQQGALRILERIGDPGRFELARACNNLGTTLSDTGDQRGALPYFERCLKIAETIGEIRLQGYALVGMGECRSALREDEAAERALVEATAVFAKCGIPHMVATADADRAPVLARRGDREGALQCIAHALKQHETLSMPYEKGFVLMRAAEATEALGAPNESRDHLAAAVKMFTESGAKAAARQAEERLQRLASAGSAPAALPGSGTTAPAGGSNP